MTVRFENPRAEGQLVWCPADPSQGVGVVTGVSGTQVRVRFLRQQEERIYTTRGESVLVRYEIQAGERVRHADGREVRVLSRTDEPESELDLALYEVDDGSDIYESDLVPDVRDVGARERLASLNLVHPAVVRARVQGMRVANIGSRPGMAAILGARALWLPHQIDVAARAVGQDPVRMLLADEVGLGKTVEAALIYAGLRHEGRADRVLILTPESLCIQWLGEIYRKGHELMVLLDEDRLEDAAQDFPDLSPFDAYQRIVTSIDRVCADPSLFEAAVSAQWDLVVVDEAHHLRWDADTGGNAGYQLIEQLAGQTRHLLLLTATPMALDPAEYHALLRLLDQGRFDDPSDFEGVTTWVARIREVARHIAEAIESDSTLSDDVCALAHEVLDDDPEDKKRLIEFIHAKPTDAQREDIGEDVLDALRARHGLADYVVRNRRGPVGGLPERRPQIFPLEPTDAQADLIEAGETVMLELARTIEDPHQSYETLGRMLRALWATPRALSDILKPVSEALAGELEPYIDAVVQAPLDKEGLPTADARLRWLARLFRRLEPGDKLLVFVETSVAVRALKDALEPVLGADIAMFHKGLAPRDRDRQVAWFREPHGPSIMLSTEAGGEGRNFQFCHQVVLYDMPWRPATVEQRIGRIDRVGQSRDVHVLVPHFKGGYEAAILKVMQQSIGVLDRTVGGIDHALEYVSDRLGELVLEGRPADDWKALYMETAELIKQTRDRIEAAVDPILDHASFSPKRVAELLEEVPEDLEAQTEAFVRGYAEHSKLDLHTKEGELVAIEGAPSASGAKADDASYVATFSRTVALDHEDVEFLSFGHPLVEEATDWARTAGDASAGLALLRGCNQDGAAFLWTFGLSLPDDVPEVASYVASPILTYAVDESGDRHRELESLLDNDNRRLDRMDAGPLRGAQKRWRGLVEQNYGAAMTLVESDIGIERTLAAEALRQSTESRRRDLSRQYNRELARLSDDSPERDYLSQDYNDSLAALDEQQQRIETAIANIRSRLLTVVAVRLVKAKHVSG